MLPFTCLHACMINLFSNSVLRDLPIQSTIQSDTSVVSRIASNSNPKARTKDFMFSLLPIHGYILCVMFCVHIVLLISCAQLCVVQRYVLPFDLYFDIANRNNNNSFIYLR